MRKNNNSHKKNDAATSNSNNTSNARKKGSGAAAEKLEFVNSHNPDGTVRESLMFGNRKIWVRRVNPSRIPELREQVATIMAESFDEALKGVEVMKLLLDELKWSIIEEKEKHAYTLNEQGDTVRYNDKIWKIKCPGWTSSAHLRSVTDGRVELILDVALIAHFNQFLKDLKTVTEADIEAWNKGVEAIKRKKEAKKKNANWVKTNTAVFSMAAAFSSIN